MNFEASEKKRNEPPFRIEELAQCLEGLISFNYIFERPVTRAFVTYFQELGKLEYRDDLPRPLYKVTRPKGFYLVGVVGAREIRVDYEEYWMAETRKMLEERFDWAVETGRL